MEENTIELSHIFSLCDIGGKGFVTYEDMLEVGSHYGPQMNTILRILRLQKGDHLTLEEFMERVNEGSGRGGGGTGRRRNRRHRDEEELEEEYFLNSEDLVDRDSSVSIFEGVGGQCLMSPSNTTSALGSSIVTDFEAIDADMKIALRKIEDQLTGLKETQADSKQDLSYIIESVSSIEKKEKTRSFLEKEHREEISRLKEEYLLESRRDRIEFQQRLNEKASEIGELNRELKESALKYNDEIELLKSEVESLKLVNVVLEQKLEFLKDHKSSENEEISRQWRQIQLDKERLEDEKIEIGFEKVVLATDQEDLKLEQKELNFKNYAQFHDRGSPSNSPRDILRDYIGNKPLTEFAIEVFGHKSDALDNLEKIITENKYLRKSFEEVEAVNYELKRSLNEYRAELLEAQKEINVYKKKLDPMTTKSSLIMQFRDSLHKRKDSKFRFNETLSEERSAYMARERELMEKNDKLSSQLADARRKSDTLRKKKSPPVKCVVTEEDFEVNKQIIFEKKCLSLIIDDLKVANENLTQNLRILESENKKFRSKMTYSEIETPSGRSSSFSNDYKSSSVNSKTSTSSKGAKFFVKKFSELSKSTSSLNNI